MKRFFYLPLLLIAIIMMGGNVLNAQIIVENNQSAKLGIKSPVSRVTDSRKVKKHDIGNGLSFSRLLNEPAVTEGETYTVTCIFQNDPDKFYEPYGIFVTGPNSGDFGANFYTIWPETDVIVCKVPAGTYDFVSQVFRKGPKESSSTCNAIIVKELVEVNKDTTIYFNHEEATNHYTIQTIKPNGDELTIGNYILDENGMPIDTIAVANVTNVVDIQFLQLKDNGYVYHGESYGGVIIDGGEALFDIMMNDVSDRYKLVNFRIVQDNDGTAFFCKYETSSMADHILKSKTNQYAKYEDKFIASPSSNLDNDSYLVGFTVEQCINNSGMWNFSMDPVFEAKNGKVVTYIDAPKSTDEKANYDMLVAPNFVDGIQTFVDEWVWYDEDGNEHVETDYYSAYSTINGLPVLQNTDGTFEYVNYGIYDFRTPVGGGDYVAIPGHPQFSYVKNQKALDYGSNCPINMLTPVIRDDRMASFYCDYQGRYGEVRSCDNNSMQTEVKYNDEVFCTDYNNMFMDFRTLCQEKPDGVITAHFVDGNVMVDGLQGQNVTDVYFDQRQEDETVPSLQALHFKNSDGNIIDRFETADEGVLEFAAGDFDFVEDMEINDRWYVCKPLNVEVSYSPYCTDQWLPLEVNEVPENYFMPGFGYFYRGSLQGVTNGSATGWYDLMVKLTDASGNWQQQVISPAFRIGNATPTGIEVVKSEDATEVARYTVDGRAISAPQSGVNIVKMSDGTVKKVLVK